MVTSRAPQHVFRELTSCLDTETLLDLARRFSETYERLAKTSTEHFLITPVTALPTGKEKGKFLAIDVGGSNLRVGFVELVGDLETHHNEDGRQDIAEDALAKVKRSHDKSWPIEDHMKMDKAEDLFTWIGDCMAQVVREAIDDTTISTDDEILLGVTFSFPMAQTRLSEATLLPMGKGFAITTNLDLGERLLTGYSRHCAITTTDNPLARNLSSTPNGDPLPRIRVAAITNDTVATFVSLAYAVKAAPNSRVAMGLIVGTGTNATVPMKLGTLLPSKRSDLQDLGDADTVVINTEWTIRGTDRPLDDLNIKTHWDRTLDADSEAPGFQPFEYMTSGRYLGEIVRLIFLDIVSAELGPHGNIPASLQHKNAITTRFLSEVVARAKEDSLPYLLEKVYPLGEERSQDGFWTPARALLLRDVARAVQRRSSALIAAACIGLLDCVGDISLNNSGAIGPSEAEELVIAYAGSTISQYPHWLEDCQKWIDEIMTALGENLDRRVVLKEALDGGIIGAGVLAGMGDRIP